MLFRSNRRRRTKGRRQRLRPGQVAARRTQRLARRRKPVHLKTPSRSKRRVCRSPPVPRSIAPQLAVGRTLQRTCSSRPDPLTTTPRQRHRFVVRRVRERRSLPARLRRPPRCPPPLQRRRRGNARLLAANLLVALALRYQAYGPESSASLGECIAQSWRMGRTEGLMLR